MGLIEARLASAAVSARFAREEATARDLRAAKRAARSVGTVLAGVVGLVDCCVSGRTFSSMSVGGGESLRFFDGGVTSMNSELFDMR